MYKAIRPNPKRYPLKDGSYYYDYYGKPVMNWLFWNRLDNMFSAIKKLNISRKVNALELGTGGGIALLTLSEFFDNITGIDISPDIIVVDKWIKKQYPQISEKIKLIRGDARKLPFKNNSQDIVFAFDTLEHIPDVDKVIKEIYRVLKPKGYICFTIPIEGIIHHIGRFIFRLGDPSHYKGIVKSHNELVNLFNENFNITIDISIPFKYLPRSFNAFRLVILTKK